MPAGGAAEEGGLHFVTLEGLVEAPTGSNAFAVVEVQAGALQLTGHGCATTRSLPLRPMQ
jgi:hypothetical protein